MTVELKPAITQFDSAAVDYLKVLGIILVIIEHSIIFFIPTDLIFSFPIWLIGVAGVGLFAYSSGYLAKATSSENFNPRKYLVKRFFRLYPLYLLALVLSFGLTPGLTLNFKIFSLFLLQSFDSGGAAWFALWFVPFIMLCYVFFSVYRVNNQLFKVIMAIFAVAFISVICLFATSISMIIFALELPVMIFVFFLGARTAHIPLKFKKAPTIIKKLSRLAYPIYLFQYPFFIAMQQNGLVLSLVCIALAGGIFYLSTEENLFKNKKWFA